MPWGSPIDFPFPFPHYNTNSPVANTSIHHLTDTCCIPNNAVLYNPCCIRHGYPIRLYWQTVTAVRSMSCCRITLRRLCVNDLFDDKQYTEHKHTWQSGAASVCDFSLVIKLENCNVYGMTYMYGTDTYPHTCTVHTCIYIYIYIYIQKPHSISSV